ncbi:MULTISPECIES: NAD-dependent succinate-semialdehyde dehydrogenase [Corynebacterium]|jgi:succinate-semialdehyde dehydrogenase/glutarate-semialdehyde dehydrogenase|uniref:NAD-dependent succinate-semialdehyde dehydrogenase n=1 Tax=Corynebacterium TaxID=1716 RepID=UPI00082DAA55|nr:MULTISPECIES: NAD-dependent succinate-semialdehyde dehydrogenase [Corynebacterium]MCI1256897.1 NAD-dependent succinate-semialdehyde dehydrogenase [Corynebacterium provencense]
MPTTINPATGDVLARYTDHTAAETDTRLTAAHDAFLQWRTVPVTDRTALLTAMASALRADEERFAQLITAEMGKPVTEARAEVAKSALTLDYYAENAADFLAFEEIASDAAVSGLQYDPLGVVLAIMPWNYPFWQFFRFAAPAFAAGNGAVLKHASNVTGCALAIQEIVDTALAEVSAPAGLFQTLVIPSSEVHTVIEDDRIAAVTLTGSTEVGALVASQAGKALKKQVLELGGSDPFVVLADADLEAAASTAVASRFNSNGQSCVNAKRFIVDESVADAFTELVVAKAGALTVGDPTDDSTQIGPMARADLRAALHDQVERSIAQGSTLLLGGEVPDGPGAYYPPTILGDVRPGHAAFDEETFGPVATITRAAGEDEAVALANTTEYGLGATVFSGDPATARRVAGEIEAGAVFINGKVASDPRLPFGGIKRSGYGRELSHLGIREFTNTKTIWIGK